MGIPYYRDQLITKVYEMMFLQGEKKRNRNMAENI